MFSLTVTLPGDGGTTTLMRRFQDCPLRIAQPGGRMSKIIARRLDVAYKTVWVWEKHLRSQGPHSWREAKQPRGPRKIDAQQRKRPRELLLQGALAQGTLRTCGP